ncbi:hypothetical protein BGW41_003833 [Actinomortierella wolfii]|nr:hypothetical protein BGW41_003833 [Actinomortierella wolfii]
MSKEERPAPAERRPSIVFQTPEPRRPTPTHLPSTSTVAEEERESENEKTVAGVDAYLAKGKEAGLEATLANADATNTDLGKVEAQTNQADFDEGSVEVELCLDDTRSIKAPTVRSIVDGKIMTYPDGGFGWLVVLASFVVNFWAFGPNLTWGVFQEYHLRAGTFPGVTASQLSWVGSIGTSAMFAVGPFIAPMMRFIGMRAVVAVGIFVCGAGYILASFSKQLWHLYLTQGLLFGLGGGVVFFSTIAVTTQYFLKKRGLANGLAVAGSGLGGLALAPLNRALITKVGVWWTLRILGICILAFMAAIFPFVRPRIKGVKKGPIFDFGVFKLKGFLPLIGCAFTVTFGYLIPIFLIPTYATREIGMTPTAAANLVSIKNEAMVITFMIFYGLFGGGFISVFPVATAQVVSVERLPPALGMLYFGNIFGNLLGTPIATAIINAMDGRYTGAMIFSAATPLVASLFALYLRFSTEKRIFAIA